MSLRSAGSFSVRSRIPVAWGAKTCTMPFWMSDLATAAWTCTVRSVESISPFVAKVRVVLATLKVDKVVPVFLFG